MIISSQAAHLLIILYCRLGLEVKKEENLADWYSQVTNNF